MRAQEKNREKIFLKITNKQNMELTRQIENLKFSDPSNVGSFRKITIKNEKEKSLFIATGKCFSDGVKKDLRYKSTSMSLVLDDDTVKKFENIIEQCEKHLGKSISKFLYRRDDDTVTIYAKLKMAKGEILTKFCKDGKEIGPMNYEGKHCELKAVLAIEGISLNGEKLQVKIHDANVREKVYEHVWLVDMEW